MIPPDTFSFQTTQGAWADNTPPYDFQIPGTPSSSLPNGTGVAAWACNRIKTFECPSDSAYGAGVWVWDIYLMPAVPDGYYADVLPSNPADPRMMALGVSNYAANAGYGLYLPGGGVSDPYVGPFGINSKSRITDISDGTSNTLAFGETVGGACYGQRDTVVAWAGAGAMPIGYGLPDSCGWWTFGSKHSGVVNFAFCDGSVRPIRKGIVYNPGADPNGGQGAPPPGPDAQALFNVAGVHDGSVVDFSQLRE